MKDQIEKKPEQTQPYDANSDLLLVTIRRLKEAQDRNGHLTDDGGTSGRTDTNDNAIF